MKLLSSAETFNLGDTSFRRKVLIEDYNILLPLLKQINDEYINWNKESQGAFYIKSLNQTDLFSRNDTEDPAKRGRTLTNALVKTGLTDEKRNLSSVAINWINESITPMDDLEKLFGIDINNVLFLRQLVKLRVYDSVGKNYFYPFRFALQLLIRYRNIPQQDFLTIIHLIQPAFSEQKIKEIINNYGKVATNDIIFSEFLDNNFPEESTNTSFAIESLFDNETINRQAFNSIFVNRKTTESQDIYYDFVVKLLKFKKAPNSENLESLVQSSTNAQIKKAFGFGKSVFIRKTNVTEFYDENSDNALLSNNNRDIYGQFVLSKKDDIVKEYRDMTRRTFNLTGIIDFSNGLVNATNQEILEPIFNNISIAGAGQYTDYEQNLNFTFYQDIPLSDILHLDTDIIFNRLKKVLDVTDKSKVLTAVVTQKENKFRSLISQKFPKDKIMEILPLFSERNDSEIHKLVSEYATIPTIFEYIVGIAWYHISNENFSISKSLNLTLDGNMLPLSHAVGGAGDIVIDYKNMTLMIEVTLMNAQAQKRGEWEPVLRHATNLTVSRSPKNVTTLFVADKLDDNTVNIWRAVASVPMRATNNNEFTSLVKIFPMTNSELLKILDQCIDEHKLLKDIDSSYNVSSESFDLSWRDKILKKSISQ
ncbi:AlwI family type II restriction endonuclease [Leuconostoc citreum]|uniref:AlwI family type II restriction endonuclease n=1 Tax=Leuconostoc citreum TaxID=33964 RepID=UPI0021A6AD98|nr:AlwI family type II restriction endonuclease [Leuconostoc citreum]MCT3054672.1 AlwI family type II restriction endonuclease [Leuconostoc citreum]MCT3062631.1 AlwI family type II restriction endonuclease [Leuconostoc citreum]